MVANHCHCILLDPVAVVALLVHVAVLAGVHGGLGLHHLTCWGLAVLRTESQDSQADLGMMGPVGLVWVGLGTLGQRRIWHLGE